MALAAEAHRRIRGQTVLPLFSRHLQEDYYAFCQDPLKGFVLNWRAATYGVNKPRLGSA